MLAARGAFSWSWMVFCLKSAGKLQLWAVAIAISSSSNSSISCLQPGFSMSAERLVQSIMTVRGWNVIGLWSS